jgi:hypothetical protein
MLAIDDLRVVAQVLEAALIHLTDEKEATLRMWPRVTGLSLEHQRARDFEAGWNAALVTLWSKVEGMYNRCEGVPQPN